MKKQEDVPSWHAQEARRLGLSLGLADASEHLWSEHFASRG
jgi:hypothetical protein